MALCSYAYITDNWSYCVIRGVHVLDKWAISNEHHLFDLPAVPARAAYQAHSTYVPLPSIQTSPTTCDKIWDFGLA